MKASSASKTAPANAASFSTLIPPILSVSLPTFLVGALAVEIRDSLRLSTSELGIAISISDFGAAIWSVPSGKHLSGYFAGKSAFCLKVAVLGA